MWPRGRTRLQSSRDVALSVTSVDAWDNRVVRIGRFEYPATPPLADGEIATDVFEGARARVTLTDRRIVVSRFGHLPIRYAEVVAVDGGFYAGPTDLRENTMIAGGLYLRCADGREEWVHIPQAADAAALIRERATNLCPVGEDVHAWGTRVRAGLPPREPSMPAPPPVRIAEHLLFGALLGGVPALFWGLVATHGVDSLGADGVGVVLLLVSMTAWAAFALYMLGLVLARALAR